MAKLVKNSLGFDSNLFVYQDKDMFSYSVDTILLGNFATINKNTKNILEVGTNNGALSIFVSERSKDIHIDAIEIQKEAIELANKNVKLNKKSKQIRVIHNDFNDYWQEHNKTRSHKYDLIICNPPFYKVDSSHKKNGSNQLHIATHEIKLNLEQLIIGSAKLLRQKGYLAMVYPTERLVDIFCLLRQYGFEPKRVQMVFPRINEKSNLVLVEARFRTGWGTHFLKNLYLHPEDKGTHEYNNKIKALYKPIIKEKGIK